MWWFIEFGRFASRPRSGTPRRTEALKTFELLGFTHICAKILGRTFQAQAG